MGELWGIPIARIDAYFIADGMSEDDRDAAMETAKERLIEAAALEHPGCYLTEILISDAGMSLDGHLCMGCSAVICRPLKAETVH